MLVYNTNNAIGEGFYYWDGSSWVKFIANSPNSDAWLRTGNAGTNPATNFIGTTDNQALAFRTNDTVRMTIASNGNVGIGNLNPSEKLVIQNGGLVLTGEDGIGFMNTPPRPVAPIHDGARIYFINDGTPITGVFWQDFLAFEKVDENHLEPDGGIAFFNRGSDNIRKLSMMIRGSGNVGIGTVSPTDRLQVTGGNIRVGEINPTNTGTLPGYGRLLYFSGGPSPNNGGTSENSDPLWIARYNISPDVSELRVNIGDNPTTTLLDAFHVLSDANNTDRSCLYVRSDARVGIGTTTPGGQFELSVDQGRKPGTNTWTVFSDERLKDIHGPYSKGLNEILKLNPVTYNYKNVGERTFAPEVLKTTAVGFSAQEVQKVFPEAVGVDDDGYLNFNMHAILVAYVNAIKEQQAIIEAQKMEIELLKQNSTELKAEIDFIKSQIRAGMYTSNR
jgi:hypothetical protein